jgi:hypothetical protein
MEPTESKEKIWKRIVANSVVSVALQELSDPLADSRDWAGAASAGSAGIFVFTAARAKCIWIKAIYWEALKCHKTPHQTLKHSSNLEQMRSSRTMGKAKTTVPFKGRNMAGHLHSCLNWRVILPCWGCRPGVVNGCFRWFLPFMPLWSDNIPDLPRPLYSRPRPPGGVRSLTGIHNTVFLQSPLYCGGVLSPNLHKLARSHELTYLHSP